MGIPVNKVKSRRTFQFDPSVLLPKTALRGMMPQSERGYFVRGRMMDAEQADVEQAIAQIALQLPTK